ncbi:MAG TPA: hypothetical protein VGG28_32475 [Kofleriaceae bacterium]
MTVCLLGCASHDARHSEHAHSRADGVLAAFVELAVDAAFSSSGGGDAPDAGEQLPDRIDHDMAAFALVDALPALQRCALAAPIPLTITVRPNGEVETVQVQAPPVAQHCVTDALGGLDFPRTVHGGRFRWSVAAAPPPPPPVDGSAT